MSKLFAAVPILIAVICPVGRAQNAAPAPAKQQPTAPSKAKPRTDAEIQEFFHNAKTAHFKVTPQVANPRAAEALNPAILQELKAQKLAASSVPSHTMGAAGDPAGGSSNPPSSVGPSHARPATAVATTRAPVATTPPPSSSSNSKQAMKAPAPLQNVCPPGPGPGVFNVNGKAHGAIFTPDPNGNEYTIVGCRFGHSNGDVHLEGGFKAGTVPLVIESWSDTVIKARMNPALTGEPDKDNVSLVVVPVGSPGLARVAGFKFYAVREQVTLRSFPQTGVKLAAITATDGKPVPAQFSSPYTNRSSPGTFSGGVDRNHQARFDPGVDVWDLSRLAPGFEPLNLSLGYWASEGCGVDVLPADKTIYNDGKWSARWDPQNSRRIIVNFAEQHCHKSPSLMQLGDDESNSSYALTITVIGPRGVSPW